MLLRFVPFLLPKILKNRTCLASLFDDFLAASCSNDDDSFDGDAKDDNSDNSNDNSYDSNDNSYGRDDNSYGRDDNNYDNYDNDDSNDNSYGKDDNNYDSYDNDDNSENNDDDNDDIVSNVEKARVSPESWNRIRPKKKFRKFVTSPAF